MPGNHSRRRMCNRNGAATVELAVGLPLMLLIMFGCIECSNMIFVNHSLHIASYEGIRVAIRSEATNAEVTDRCNEIINARQVVGGTVTISVPNVSTVPAGQQITVTVSAPSNANYTLVPTFFGGRNLVGRTTMVKE